MPAFCFSQFLHLKKLIMGKIKKKAAGRQIEPESLPEEMSTKSTSTQRPKTSFDIPFLITSNLCSTNYGSTVLTQALLSEFSSAQGTNTTFRDTSYRTRNGSPLAQTPLCMSPIYIYPTSTRASAMYWFTICIPALIKRSTT